MVRVMQLPMGETKKKQGLIDRLNLDPEEHRGFISHMKPFSRERWTYTKVTFTSLIVSADQD